MRVFLSKDFLAGFAIAALGTAFVIGSLGLEIGTPANMGPGFFPLFTGILSGALGLAIATSGVLRSVAVEPPEWRPLIFISFAIAAFAVVLPLFGMIPALLACVILAAYARTVVELKTTTVMAISIAVIVWFVFSIVLGLTIPALKGPF